MACLSRIGKNVRNFTERDETIALHSGSIQLAADIIRILRTSLLHSWSSDQHRIPARAGIGSARVEENILAISNLSGCLGSVIP